MCSFTICRYSICLHGNSGVAKGAWGRAPQFLPPQFLPPQFLLCPRVPPPPPRKWNLEKYPSLKWNKKRNNYLVLFHFIRPFPAVWDSFFTNFRANRWWRVAYLKYTNTCSPQISSSKCCAPPPPPPPPPQNTWRRHCIGSFAINRKGRSRKWIGQFAAGQGEKERLLAQKNIKANKRTYSKSQQKE